MVKKHPHMFLGADLVVINKTDLAAAMEVSVDELTRDVQTLKPSTRVFPISCKNGAGINEVAAALLMI
jgi:hydrogenase nickel incorporation protein HypB